MPGQCDRSGSGSGAEIDDQRIGRYERAGPADHLAVVVLQHLGVEIEHLRQPVPAMLPAPAMPMAAMPVPVTGVPVPAMPVPAMPVPGVPVPGVPVALAVAALLPVRALRGVISLLLALAEPAVTRPVAVGAVICLLVTVFVCHATTVPTFCASGICSCV